MPKHLLVTTITKALSVISTHIPYNMYVLFLGKNGLFLNVCILIIQKDEPEGTFIAIIHCILNPRPLADLNCDRIAAL